MSMIATLRKGLKFLLMSMGISSPERPGPAKKPRPTSRQG